MTRDYGIAYPDDPPLTCTHVVSTCMSTSGLYGDAAGHVLMTSKTHNMTRDYGTAYPDDPPLTCTHVISTRMPASGSLADTDPLALVQWAMFRLQ